MSEKVSYVVTLEDWDANFDQVRTENMYHMYYVFRLLLACKDSGMTLCTCIGKKYFLHGWKCHCSQY